MDFQLSSYLGWLIGTSNGSISKYYIVSNDKGYDCLCKYWSSFNVVVKRIEVHENILKSKASLKSPKTESKNIKKDVKKEAKKNKEVSDDIATLADIDNYLSNADKPGDILLIFNKFNRKQEIYNQISKKLKNTEKASAIYNKLKPLMQKKNKK